MESLPTGDNTDTQVPISPASYEHTASMKAMLKNEDEKLAALQKGGGQERACMHMLSHHDQHVFCACGMRVRFKSLSHWF